jgi:hypothetical protein
MTSGLKPDPYGTPGRYMQSGDGEVVIRTQYGRDQDGIVALRNTALPIIDALMAENERLRRVLSTASHDVQAQAATLPGYFPEPITALPTMAAIMQGHFNDIAARMNAALVQP